MLNWREMDSIKTCLLSKLKDGKTGSNLPYRKKTRFHTRSSTIFWTKWFWSTTSKTKNWKKLKRSNKRSMNTNWNKPKNMKRSSKNSSARSIWKCNRESTHSWLSSGKAIKPNWLWNMIYLNTAFKRERKICSNKRRNKSSWTNWKERSQLTKLTCV